MIYQGSCHCRAVTFEVEAPDVIEANRCNCSICTKSGFLHLIVPLSKFKLLSGKEHLTTYTFNTGVAKHTFCRVCGIKPFYTPRSNPDGVDVNVHCLDIKPESIRIERFDGQNWEEHAHELAHKSKETQSLALRTPVSTPLDGTFGGENDGVVEVARCESRYPTGMESLILLIQQEEFGIVTTLYHRPDLLDIPGFYRREIRHATLGFFVHIDHEFWRVQKLEGFRISSNEEEMDLPLTHGFISASLLG